MIHIVFVLHDLHGSYGKYNAIAMTSLFENTEENVTIHFIHDHTLTIENKKKFTALCNKYEKNICFYEVEAEKCFQHEYFSRGTFFRLYIPELLSKDIKKIIYLDTDICVDMDINELWCVDFAGYAVAAVEDSNISQDYWMCEDVDKSYIKSFNAGVLLMNLEKIRNKYDLVESTVDFLQRYPQAKAADQDALNSILHSDCLFIPRKFNVFADKDTPAVAGNLYHFVGEYKPWKTYFTYLSRVYWRYFEKSEWGTSAFIADLYFQMKQKTEWFIHFYQTVYDNKKIILFGAGDIGGKMLSRVHIKKERDYYVDNNSSKWGGEYRGIPVYSPQKILEENKGKSVIILCLVGCQPVKNFLEEHSLQENIDFFDGRKLFEIEGGGSFWGK